MTVQVLKYEPHFGTNVYHESDLNKSANSKVYVTCKYKKAVALIYKPFVALVGFQQRCFSYRISVIWQVSALLSEMITVFPL